MTTNREHQEEIKTTADSIWENIDNDFSASDFDETCYQSGLDPEQVLMKLMEY